MTVDLAKLQQRIKNAKTQFPKPKGSSDRMWETVAKNKYPGIAKQIKQLSRAQKDAVFGVGVDPMFSWRNPNFKYPAIKKKSPARRTTRKKG